MAACAQCHENEAMAADPHEWKRCRFCLPCAWCEGHPIREVLDNEPLCQKCCNAWAMAEGNAAMEIE